MVDIAQAINAAMADPRFQQGLDMMAGISPAQRAQIQGIEMRNRAMQEEMERERATREAMAQMGDMLVGGKMSLEAIERMMKINPKIGGQMLDTYRDQQQKEREAMIFDPSVPLEQKYQIAVDSRNPAAMQYLERVAQQEALANLPTTRQPMTQPMREPQGLLDLGAPQSPAGQAFMDMGQPEQLPPLQGMENLPAMPQEGNDRMSRILQEMEIEGAREAAGDPMAKGRMMRLKEELDLAKSQIPSPSDLRQKEKQDLEMKQLQTKALSGLRGFEQQTKLVTNTIDKALQTISPFSTGYGAAVLADLPNTEARKLRGYLDTIKANIGFDRLQQMRDNSPTGGALGQVSELENRLLQATQGALDPLQSELLQENLKIIRETYPRVMEEKRRAYQSDFGAIPKQDDVNAPPSNGVQNMSDDDLLKALGL